MVESGGTRPSQLALASYGSLLRRPVVGWLIGAALIALIVFGLYEVMTIMDLSRPAVLGVFALTIFVTVTVSLVPLAILRWLDRREPEPWSMYAIAFLWGGLIATGVSADVNLIAVGVFGDFVEGLLPAPFIEEAAKGLGLIALLLCLRSEFDGPRDGFIYGALIGLGFNCLETSVYVARDFASTGDLNLLIQLSTRYSLLGLNGHALYTAITGTFLGFALLQKSWFRRVSLALLGYFVAALSHAAWNTVGVFASSGLAALIAEVILGRQASEPGSVPSWANWPAAILALLIVNSFSLLVVIVGLRRSNLWERRVMGEELGDEVGSEVITSDEYANVRERCEPPKEETGRRIFAAQCNLAKRKFYLSLHDLPVESDPLVTAWRDEASALRRPEKEPA